MGSWQKVINNLSIFCLKIVAGENEWRGGTLWEWILDELEVQDNSDLTETNYELAREKIKETVKKS